MPLISDHSCGKQQIDGLARRVARVRPERPRARAPSRQRATAPRAALPKTARRVALPKRTPAGGVEHHHRTSGAGPGRPRGEHGGCREGRRWARLLACPCCLQASVGDHRAPPVLVPCAGSGAGAAGAEAGGCCGGGCCCEAPMCMPPSIIAPEARPGEMALSAPRCATGTSSLDDMAPHAGLVASRRNVLDQRCCDGCCARSRRRQARREGAAVLRRERRSPGGVLRRTAAPPRTLEGTRDARIFKGT